MKIYLKSHDHKISIDVDSFGASEDGVWRAETVINKMPVNLYFKRGRTKNFFSTDNVAWHPINRNSHLQQIAFGDQVFSIHYGFLPSQKAEEKGGSLIAKMPGKVVKVLKNAGDLVKKGDPILIIEAMKMENEIKANAEGLIEKICVTPGQNINSGELLVAIKQ